MKISAFLLLCKDAFHDVIEHDGVEHAGYLAFLGFLSLFPFLVLLVSLAGYVGATNSSALLSSLLFSDVLPVYALEELQPRVEEILSGPPQNLLTLAIFGVLWSASSGVEGVRTILNRVARVQTPPSYLRRKILSIVQCLLFITFLILTMLALVVVPFIADKLQLWFGFDFSLPPLFEQLHVLAALLVLGCGVALVYYFVPNVRQSFSAVLPGAMVAVGLWYFIAILFSFYISQFSNVHVVYGSLGGIIAALLFFYVSAIIFIFGAEVNYHLGLKTSVH